MSHNIPGARKRRDRRHGPREPSGWTLSPDRKLWSHRDGRWLLRTFGGDWLSDDHGFYVDPKRDEGGGHAGKFREGLPF